MEELWVRTGRVGDWHPLPSRWESGGGQCLSNLAQDPGQAMPSSLSELLPPWGEPWVGSCAVTWVWSASIK